MSKRVRSALIVVRAANPVADDALVGESAGLDAEAALLRIRTEARAETTNSEEARMIHPSTLPARSTRCPSF